MTMTELNQQTALYNKHRALGAVFTNFGGWDMPLRYGSELAEHRAVREAAGLFDLSHMGEVWISGPDAAVFLNTALVGNLGVVRVGKAKYTLICLDNGGIVDDLIVYRVAETRYLVVPNAGNAVTVAGLLAERAHGFDVEVVDASLETSLIAVQGPNAAEIVRAVVPSGERETVTELGYYAWAAVTVLLDSTVGGGVEVLLARTGYTGEDGFELFLPNERAAEVWARLLEAGAEYGLVPCGLAARDSLRLEAGMPLYGNELGPSTTPFDAGLGGVISFKKPEAFIGRTALEVARDSEQPRVLVGLRGLSRRAGRAGYTVHAAPTEGEALAADAPAAEAAEIGVITSGQPSPTLGYPIALARVDRAFSEVGTRVTINLRGKFEPAEVVPLPFYSRELADAKTGSATVA